MAKNGLDLTYDKHHGQMSPLPRPDSAQLVIDILVQDIPVEEYDRVKGLVLGGRRNFFPRPDGLESPGGPSPQD